MTRRPPIVEAAAAFQKRDFVAARNRCREILSLEPSNADAMHLQGLVARQLGELDEAERLIRASVDRKPANAEFRVNYANLLRSLGRLADAETELRKSLEIEPGSRSARLTLARVLNERGRADEAAVQAKALLRRNSRDAEALVQLAAAERALGRLDEAASTYEKVFAVSPDYAVARHNYAALLCEMQHAEQALEQLEQSAELGIAGPELHYNRASAHFTLARFDDAEAELRTALSLRPAYIDAHTLLAKLRFMRGDPGFVDELAAAAVQSEDSQLTLALGDLLRRGGRPGEAAAILTQLAGRYPDSAEIASSLAVVLQELGEIDDAVAHARRAHAARPGSAEIVENLVAMLLQLGEAAEAKPLIDAARQRQPGDQRWLAYTATAARLSGDAEYEGLCDYERFVQIFDIEPPRGFASIEALHEELVPRLAERHRFESHPLDQSLRHGTQTARDLRRDPDPVIRGFLEAVGQPITEYRARIGDARAHPFTARNRGEHRLAGCWSVRLGQGGYHVNHIHPKGWISSAYYVQLPAETREAGKSGWLKFGEPRRETPGADADHFVEPKAGRLVLFPSYLWHGTTPIHGDEPRMTIAFDAVTAAPPPA